MFETDRTLSLHRYFIWANRMRTHFDALPELSSLEFGSPRFTEAFLYMSYWYAGLYVVIEGWKHLGLQDPVVDALLASPNVDLLRRYRNGVFHFQRDYTDKRFMEFIDQGIEQVTWVRELNQQFGRFFLQQPHQ